MEQRVRMEVKRKPESRFQMDRLDRPEPWEEPDQLEPPERQDRQDLPDSQERQGRRESEVRWEYPEHKVQQAKKQVQRVQPDFKRKLDCQRPTGVVDR